MTNYSFKQKITDMNVAGSISALATQSKNRRRAFLQKIEKIRKQAWKKLKNE